MAHTKFCYSSRSLVRCNRMRILIAICARVATNRHQTLQVCVNNTQKSHSKAFHQPHTQAIARVQISKPPKNVQIPPFDNNDRDGGSDMSSSSSSRSNRNLKKTKEEQGTMVCRKIIITVELLEHNRLKSSVLKCAIRSFFALSLFLISFFLLLLVCTHNECER